MSQERSEQPTPKRLRESRERGEVCKSQEVISVAVILTLVCCLILGGGTILEMFSAMALTPMAVIDRPFAEALPLVAGETARVFVLVSISIVGLVMAAALIAGLGQMGFIFSLQAAKPQLSNVNPQKWFEKVFSLRNLVELLRNIFKLSVLTFAVEKVLSEHLPKLFSINHGNAGAVWTVAGSAMQSLLLLSTAYFCIIAALDYLYQRWQFNRDHMMSKDEVKKEYKEMEGDPRIKSKRKQLHQELIAQNSLDNVRRARVLVTNPTRLAIALDYEKGKTPLPIILAKGEGLLAKRMVEVAREEGIPIMQNVPLARELFEHGAENAYIPQDLIGPVAEVIRWAQSLRKE